MDNEYSLFKIFLIGGNILYVKAKNIELDVKNNIIKIDDYDESYCGNFEVNYINAQHISAIIKEYEK
jgi:hypothetical protein